MSNQPPERFSLTDRDYLSLRDQIVEYVKHRIPDWVPGPFEPETQGDPSDFASAFVEALAYVGDLMSYYVDRAAQESNILTATTTGNVLSWAELFGYVPAIARSSEVKLELSTTNPEGVLVPNKLGIRSATGVPYVFELQFAPGADGAVPTSTRVTPTTPITVTAWEGRTRYTGVDEGLELGTSTGEPGQTFSLPDSNIDGRLDDGVHGPALWVELINYTDEVSDDAGQWDFTYTLLEAGPEDKVFTARMRADGNFYLIFGDGHSGAIPPAGYTVRVHYRVTAGAAASGENNVPAGSLTVIDGSWDSATFATLTDLKVTNPAPSFGGVDADTIDTVRSNTVSLTRAQRRAVTARDYEDIALSDGDVLTAYCSAKVWSRPTIWIYPRYPYVLTNNDAKRELLSRVQTTVNSMAMVGSSVDVIMGIPAMLNLSLVVYTWPTIRKSVVLNAVRNAIINDNVYEKLRFNKAITEEDVLTSISRNVPFRLVRYAVPHLTPVFDTQPRDHNTAYDSDPELREPQRFLPNPGELLYIDTEHLTITVNGGINDIQES